MPTVKDVRADYEAGKYKAGQVLCPTQYDAIVLLDVDANGDYVAGYYEHVNGPKKFFVRSLRYRRAKEGENTFCDEDYYFTLDGEQYGIGQCGWYATDNI